MAVKKRIIKLGAVMAEYSAIVVILIATMSSLLEVSTC